MWLTRPLVSEWRRNTVSESQSLTEGQLSFETNDTMTHAASSHAVALDVYCDD
jgi:hypothetical protein